MSSKCCLQYYADGTSKWFKRNKQGRRPSGLGKLEKYRLYTEDEEMLAIMKKNLGQYYNKNEIVRTAVHIYLCNSVPTELLKH
jgi:hypothetical protein